MKKYEDEVMAGYVEPAVLTEAVAWLLESGGCTAAIAREVAHYLVEAEMAGHGSHGARLMMLYLERLRSGAVDGHARPTIEEDLGTILKIAGNRAFGQVAGEFAAHEGTRRAIERGMCIVVLNGAGHLGRNGRWAEIAAAQGVGSMHFGQGIGKSGPVAPFGGREGRLNTNPLALGLPGPGEGGSADIIFDCSTAEIAGSRIKLALERGERLDTPCVVTADGVLTDDPDAFVHGDAAVLTFGGFKGYAISAFTEILSAVLATGGEVMPQTNSLFSIYFATDSFLGRERYRALLGEFRERITTTPPMQGVDRVVLPGDRAREIRRGRTRMGVPLSSALARSLSEGAAFLGRENMFADRWPQIAAAAAPGGSRSEPAAGLDQKAAIE